MPPDAAALDVRVVGGGGGGEGGARGHPRHAAGGSHQRQIRGPGACQDLYTLPSNPNYLSGMIFADRHPDFTSK